MSGFLICDSDAMPKRDLRQVGMVVYKEDNQRYVMWDGQDWLDFEWRDGEWRRR